MPDYIMYFMNTYDIIFRPLLINKTYYNKFSAHIYIFKEEDCHGGLGCWPSTLIDHLAPSLLYPFSFIYTTAILFPSSFRSPVCPSASPPLILCAPFFVFISFSSFHLSFLWMLVHLFLCLSFVLFLRLALLFLISSCVLLFISIFLQPFVGHSIEYKHNLFHDFPCLLQCVECWRRKSLLFMLHFPGTASSMWFRKSLTSSSYCHVTRSSDLCVKFSALCSQHTVTCNLRTALTLQ
jgi:hypothetical protein